MNVLVINWQDIKNPQAGGAEVHLHEVFSRIARLGHSVTLYCSSFPGASQEENINGIRVIRRGGRYLFNFRVPFAYRSTLIREKFNVVVDDMNKIPFFTPLFIGEPIYGVTHHLFGKSIFLEINLILAAYVYLMERAALILYRKKSIPFMVGSPSTRCELLDKGFRSEAVTLIHYGVDHNRHMQTGVPKNPVPLIGYFGRLKKYKSIDHLLQAIPAVLKRVPELKVLIVGDGDDRQRLGRVAKELNVNHCVEFTGFVPEEKKLELLQRMWFKITTSAKEGWGLTVIEANACGTPVLASDVPGLRDAVKNQETGLLYRFGDIRDLSEKIILMLTDHQLRERLTANAIEWAKAFDWDVAAKQTLALLEERIARPPKEKPI